MTLVFAVAAAIDDNTTPLIIGVISAVGVVLAAMVSSRKRPDPWDNVGKLIATYNALPTTSAARESLLGHIERTITEQTSTAATDARRAPDRASIGIVFLLTAGGLAYFAITAGGWWLLLFALVAVVLVLGAYGTVEGLLKRPRDSNGAIISTRAKS